MYSEYLPFDYQRCQGVGCDKKESCLRYLDMKEGQLYWQISSMKDPDKPDQPCEHYMPKGGSDE